ncbi:hypothetical protein GS461_15875 [Rhodococcus hoagii]|nr:hypothetical protein [Prescottella equi]
MSSLLHPLPVPTGAALESILPRLERALRGDGPPCSRYRRVTPAKPPA